MTHKELVKRAAQWLRGRCVVVITEMVSQAGETPDAIGWQGADTILVECKATRSDFLGDRKKYFRREGATSLGQFRYYLFPKGLVSPDELPPGWGMLETSGRGVRRVVYPRRFESAKRWEVAMLLSALRRVGQSAPEGISIKCYTYDTKRTATLGVGVAKEG